MWGIPEGRELAILPTCVRRLCVMSRDPLPFLRLGAWHLARAAAGRMRRAEAMARARERLGEARANQLGFALRGSRAPRAHPSLVCSIDVGADTAAHPVAAGHTWEEALEKLGAALSDGSLDRALDAAKQESRMVDEGGAVTSADPSRLA